MMDGASDYLVFLRDYREQVKLRSAIPVVAARAQAACAFEAMLQIIPHHGLIGQAAWPSSETMNTPSRHRGRTSHCRAGNQLVARIAPAVLACFAALFCQSLLAQTALDQNFRPPFFGTANYPVRVLLLPDGKYVSYFNVSSLAGRRTGAITRYFSNGALDTSFNFTTEYSFVAAATPGPAGTLLVAASKTVYGLPESGSADPKQSIYHILRLNTDGSIDTTFSATARTTAGGDVRALATQADGKILVCGLFTQFAGQARQGIARLLADGTVDTAFAPVAMTGGTATFSAYGFGLWGVPAVQSDGKILIVGDFTAINGSARPGIARLNRDGTLDTAFVPSGFSDTLAAPNGVPVPRPVRAVVVQSDGQILAGGRFSVPASFTPANTTGATYNRLPIVRLNAITGAADQTYGCFAGLDSGFIQVRAMVIQPDDSVVAVDTSVYRFNPTTGAIDTTFPQPDLIDRSPADIGEAFSISRGTDGKFLIGGSFSEVNDRNGPPNGERWSVARLNSNGTLDTTFTTSERPGDAAVPTSFLRAPDVTTLIAFDQVGATKLPAIPYNFGRLLRDGTFDTNFNPLAAQTRINYATGFLRLMDSSLVVQGITLDPTASNPNRSVRFLPDATLDLSFGQGGSAKTYSVDVPNALVLNDGQIVGVALDPQAVVSGNAVERFLPDASPDTSFQLDRSVTSAMVSRDTSQVITKVSTTAKLLASYPDGSVLLGYLATDNTYRMVRLRADGSLDPAFRPASTAATAVTSTTTTITDPASGNPITAERLTSEWDFADAQTLPSSQTIVVGNFGSYGASNARGIVRLNSDGTADTAFLSGAGAQWQQTPETSTFHPAIDNIEQQGDGRFLITGTFEAFAGARAPGIARLNSDGSVDSSFVAPATRDKFEFHQTKLARQPDGSFLLSGPYSVAAFGQSAPAFIHILGPPTIDSPLSATAIVGKQFFYQFESRGATSLSVTNRPDGMAFAATLANISWIPSAPGTFQVSLSASNDQGSTNATLTITVLQAPAGSPLITSSSSASGKVARPFKFQVTTAGGTASTRLSATGLPPGLSVDAVTGLISGTPTAEGSSDVVLTATDGNLSTSASLQLTFTADPTIPVIISSSSATIAAGQPFSYTIVAPTGISTSDVTRFDGSYTGSYTGFASVSGGGSTPVNGSVAFSVAGGVITVTEPGNGSGTISANGTANFTGAGATNGAPYSFSGTFNLNPDNSVTASGTWESQFTGGSASGSWAASRPPSVLKASTAAAVSDDVTTFTLIGTLPAGLFFDAKTGTISGTYMGNRLRDADPAERRPLSGGVISNVQLFATNSKGTSTLPLTFFAAPIGSVNISTRLDVGTADNVLIGGFIVTGNAPKRVLIRAVGPSMKAGDNPLSGALQDTTLDLYQGATLLGSNDDWRSNQEQEIKDTGVPPTDDRESAIVATLAAQTGYTAIVRGKGGGTGIGLAEIYDLGTASLDASSVSRLANISTRGTVLTADNVMIGGFIISGANTKVLARAIGPSLTAQGVSGALQDPILELHDSTGSVVASNDDWRTTQEQQIKDTTIPPTDDRESALVATLQPGAYTAVVRGKSDSTGVALVEIYNLQ